MNISAEVQAAFNDLYNLCNSSLDYSDDEQVNLYIDKVHTMVDDFQTYSGVQVHSLDTEISNRGTHNANALITLLCTFMHRQCSTPLLGSTSHKKVIPHSFHFLQDTILFYKELRLSQYVALFESNIEEDRGIHEKVSEKRNLIIAEYDTIFPQNSERNRDKLSYMLDESNSGGLSNKILLEIFAYNHMVKTTSIYREQLRKTSLEKARNRFFERTKEYMGDDLIAGNSRTYNNILRILKLQFDENVIQKRKEGGETSVNSYVTNIKRITDSVILLRKIDLVCSKGYYQNQNPIPSSSGNKIFQDHFNFLEALELFFLHVNNEFP